MILEYNLAFFAAEGPGGEKTEPASEKKLSDARKEGQVAKSKEVANALSILALFLVLKFWAGTMGTQFLGVFEDVYLDLPSAVIQWNGFLPQKDLILLCRNMVVDIVIIIAPTILVALNSVAVTPQ